MLGGVDYWSFETGFGSAGVPGWGGGGIDRWMPLGAPNVFRAIGEYVLQLPMGGGTYGGSVPSSAVVPPVVISEQPSTILPGSSPRGQISKEINVPEGFYECIINGVQRLCQEKPPEGWTDLPPVPEIFSDIIRTPVPVPVDDLEEEDMAIDWGALISGAVDIAQGQSVGGGYQPPMYQDPMEFWGQSGGAVPGTVTVNTKTGKVSACRRRRRPKMLTEGDFNTLLRISTLPNNSNVRIALAKAIGRR